MNRSEVFVKITFFFIFFLGGVGGGVQGRCVLRIEVFVNIQKKNWGGGGQVGGGGGGEEGQGGCD